MATLTDAQKRFIVKSLASGKGPTETACRVQEVWGIEISRSQVHYYNPEYSADLAPEWRNLYRETHEQYIREVDSVPIAHEGFRLRQLQELYEKAVDTTDYQLAAKLLEQAAKERGSMFKSVRHFEAAETADAASSPWPGIFVLGPPEINEMLQAGEPTPVQAFRPEPATRHAPARK